MYDVWKTDPEYLKPNFKEEDLSDEEVAQRALHDIVNELYGTKNLNQYRLERSLDELCNLFNVKCGSGDLQVERIHTNQFLRKAQ